MDALRRLCEEMSSEQRYVFEHLMEDVIQQRRERVEASAASGRRELLDGLSEPASRRRGETEQLRRSDQLDGGRTASEDERYRSGDEAETASAGGSRRHAERSGRFVDVGDDVQLRRNMRSRDELQPIAVGFGLGVDGGRSDANARDANRSTEHQGRSKYRTVDFDERQLRNQSVYETASESASSPSPVRRRETRPEVRRYGGGDGLGRGTRPPGRRRDSGSSETDSSHSRHKHGLARKRSSPDFGGKKSNLSFNASQQIGRYDGRNEPLESFLAKFESCARYVGWTENDKRFQLQMCLTGAAAQILCEVAETDSVDKIVQVLRNRFGNLNQSERFRTELKTRRRKANESLQELYSDVIRLFHLAYPETDYCTLTIFLRDAFLDSLNDRQLYVRILDKDPKNIDEALTYAVRYEAFDRGYSVLNKSESDFSQLKPKYVRLAETGDHLMDASESRAAADKLKSVPVDKLAAILDKMSKMQSSLDGQSKEIRSQKAEMMRLSTSLNGLNGQRAASTDENGAAAMSRVENSDVHNSNFRSKRNYANIICYNCGEKGHVSRKCAKPRQNRHDSNETLVKQARIRQTSRLADHVYIAAKLKANNRKIFILADTGCEANIIARRLVPDIELQRATAVMLAANGTAINVLGTAKIELIVGKMNIVVNASVSDEIDEFICGTQFLTENKCVWNFERKSLSIRGTEIKLISRPNVNEFVRRVIVAKSVEIPCNGIADCEILIPYRSLKRNDDNWLVECNQLPPAVAGNRLVVNGHFTRAMVRLVNASDRAVIFNENHCIGVSEPAEVIENAPRPNDGDGIVDVARAASGTALDFSKACDSGEVTIGAQSSFGAQKVSSFGALHNDRGNGDFTRENCHIQPLIDGLPNDVSDAEREMAVKLIHDFAHLFSRNETDIGLTNLISHKIDSGCHPPIRQTLRRHPISHLPIIDEFVDDLLKRGLIEPCHSAWASNVVLAKKKSAMDSKTIDKSCFRFCVDYRLSNECVINDPVHPPRIEDCLESLGHAKYFSLLDSASAYHQVPLADEDSRDRTAFITRRGLFRYRVLPFGEKNACATYSRLMSMVLSGLQFEIALSYLDDLVVWGSTWIQTCDRLRIVFERFSNAGLKFKVSKSKLLQKSIVFLSFLIDENGIRPDPNRVKVVTGWPTPSNLTETRAFVGTCAYYRKHIADFAAIARPLYDLTKKGIPFVWGPSHTAAFNTLKRCLTSAPVLAFPLDEGDWRLETDASSLNVAAILYQKQSGVWRVIAYASRVLSKTESSYCSSRSELLAVVFGLKQFRHFLLGRKFTIVVDNSSLQYLMKSHMLLNMEARYLSLISEFDFAIERVAGKAHSAVDGISRIPCNRDSIDLMCNKCRSSLRAVRKHQPQTKLGGMHAVDVVNATGRRIDGETGADGAMGAEPPQHATAGECGGQAVNSPAPSAFTAEATEGLLILTDDVLRTEQKRDKSIRVIVELLTQGDGCEWSDVNDADMETRILFSQRQTLFIQNDILYRRFVNTNGDTLHTQVVVPRSLRVKYLECIHGSKLAGHLGIAKSRYRLQRLAYWPCWFSDLKLYIKVCCQCNGVRRNLHERHAPLKYASTTGVFQKVHIDLTGPHTKSRNGFVYVLTVTCSFSKYLVTVPLRNKSCYTVARELVRKIYLVYGPCEIVVSDNGLEFSNELAIAINSLLDITSSKVTAYRPSGNGQAERVHAVLNKLMATVVDRDQKNWDECLPYITFAYNTSQHITTSFTPFFVMFNREAKIGIDLVSDLDSNVFEGPVAEYVSLMRERMHEAYAVVHECMKSSFERAKLRYDSRVKSCRFEVGERVWYVCPRKRRGVSSKWTMLTSGPYVIIKKINDVNFVIRLSERHRSFMVNIDRLRLYVEGEAPPKRANQSVDLEFESSASNLSRQSVDIGSVPSASSKYVSQSVDVDSSSSNCDGTSPSVSKPAGSSGGQSLSAIGKRIKRNVRRPTRLIEQ